MLGGNADLLGFHDAPDVLVDFGTDQNLSFGGGGTIAGGKIHSVADNGELHAVGGPDKSMNNFAAMDSHTKGSVRNSAMLAGIAQLCRGQLHRGSGANGVLVMFGVGLGASKDSQNPVSQKFVDCTVVSKYHRHENV